ncbi:MAG TPA: right-handed parallel beta-helix repeat-containing protein [Humisphaera sp.]|nr:right-handed parallel beta-helix repeat-containing protein [Humisphaera sp.]
MVTFWFFLSPAIAQNQVAPPIVERFVAANGNDRWSGRFAQPTADGNDGPFATLERARDALRDGRTDRGAVVWIRGGTYRRDHSFQLTAADDGTSERPVTYRAYKDERVTLLGGRSIDSFVPVTDSAILNRLEPSARGHVLQADLRALGITDFGALSTRGFHRKTKPAALELFFRDEPMRLARWPKEGYAQISAVPGGPDGGRFTCDTDHISRWVHAEDLWAYGYWAHNWADSYVKVRSIDPAAHQITTEPPHGVYGYVPRQRFCILNVLEELDQPGEWYLDRASGILYFWPPAPIEPGQAVVSMLADPMLTITGASNITIRGLRFECTRGAGAVIVGGDHNLIAGCTFTNLGTFAVSFGDHYEDLTEDLDADPTLNRNAGTDNGIVSCDISHTAEGGILLGGGDRKTLTPGRNFASNNRLSDFARWVRTYRPAIEIDGVGARVDHNKITDAPHSGIILKGNDHLVEYNELARVCTETDDAGAFYMGRDFTERGNVVRYNLFRDIGVGAPSKDVNAIYIDDCASGTLIYGNVVYKSGRGVKIGGGRNNNIDNNLFIDCDPAVYIDARGLTWMKNYFDGTTRTLGDRLAAVHFDQPPYSKRYPELTNLMHDSPAAPLGNRVLHNVSVGGSWIELHEQVAKTMISVHDNFAGDPLLIDPANLDFHFRAGSPVWQIGFRPIPLERIGIQKDEFRR